MSYLRQEQNVHDLYMIRDAILRRFSYKSYEEFLNSEYWAKVKAKTKTAKYRDNYDKCSACGCTENIHLHHEDYRWLLTKYELRSIRALCEHCHSEVHKIAYEKNINFKKAFSLLK